MATADSIQRGRDAFSRQAWREAYSLLSAADREYPLGVEDLERVATAAYLVGRDQESAQAWARAHEAWARLGDVARSVRCAYWLAFGLLNRGEIARGGGWIERARRMLNVRGVECAERGCIRYLDAVRFVVQGDFAAAQVSFAEAAVLGARFGDTELTSLARIGEGRCWIYLGLVAEGLTLLDEAMAAVTVGEVSPMAVGDAYCTVIDGCQELFDLRRAQEWTAAFSDWCKSQPELVLYRGQCLVHRAEFMLLRGAWSDAMDEVRQAVDRLARPAGPSVLSGALYVKGELHRLRGELAEAEESFHRSGEIGGDPQPGLAMLRLSQGQIEAASAAIRRVVEEVREPVARSRILAPFVEISLATGDVSAARAAAAELTTIAARRNSAYLDALSGHTTGAVLLAEGNPHAALARLRQGWAGWRDLDVPYEAARARVLIGLACRSLGDRDGGEVELDAARAVFRRLGARPALAWLEEASRLHAPASSFRLTTREVEVLRLVAAGKSNRQVAAQLVIAEKTVATHVGNILSKLGLPSRAAATAYAYEHHLVP